MHSEEKGRKKIRYQLHRTNIHNAIALKQLHSHINLRCARNHGGMCDIALSCDFIDCDLSPHN